MPLQLEQQQRRAPPRWAMGYAHAPAVPEALELRQYKGEGIMLRIEYEQHAGHYAIVLHGSISGDWVSLLDRSWRSIADAASWARITLVLTDVSFIDHDGERLLERMWREGVELEAYGCMNRHVIDRIRTQSRRLAKRPHPGRP